MAEIFMLGTIFAGAGSVKLLLDATKLLIETTLPTYELLFAWMKFFFMFCLFFMFYFLRGSALNYEKEKLK